MFNTIPKARLILYAAILGLLPILFAFFGFMSKQAEVRNLENKLELVKEKALTNERRQALNQSMREHFKEADRFYIDKQIESLSLLSPENKSLNELVSNRNYAGDERVKRRLEFLTGNQNKILFTEGNIQTGPYFQEVTATLSKPVEVNVDDLKKILSLIEGVKIPPYQPSDKRPQLMILDFKLERKEPNPDNEVFELNLKILKREFT